MNGMKLSKDKIEAAAKEYAKGDKALAKAFEAGFKACQSLTMVCRAKMPDKFDRRKKLTEEDIKEILRLRKDGWTQGELASKFGVSQYCVNYHLHHKEWKAYARIQSRKVWAKMTEEERKAHTRLASESAEYKKGLRIRGVL